MYNDEVKIFQSFEAKVWIKFVFLNDIMLK